MRLIVVVHISSLSFILYQLPLVELKINVSLFIFQTASEKITLALLRLVLEPVFSPCRWGRGVTQEDKNFPYFVAASSLFFIFFKSCEDEVLCLSEGGSVSI